LYDLAVIYLDMRKYEDAINTLKKLLKAYPDHAAGYYQMGMAYNYLERYNEALFYFRKTVELNPKDTDARRMIESIAHFTQYPEGPI